MRAILGLIAGVVAGVVAMMLVGFIGGLFFPVPGPTDPTHTDAVRLTIQNASTGAKVSILLSWFAAALAGAAVAKAISGQSWPGWTLAGLLALLLAASFLVPLPIWMQVSAVLGPLAGGLLGDRLVKPRSSAGIDQETSYDPA